MTVPRQSGQVGAKTEFKGSRWRWPFCPFQAGRSAAHPLRTEFFVLVSLLLTSQGCLIGRTPIARLSC